MSLDVQPDTSMVSGAAPSAASEEASPENPGWVDKVNSWLFGEEKKASPVRIRQEGSPAGSESSGFLFVTVKGEKIEVVKEVSRMTPPSSGDGAKSPPRFLKVVGGIKKAARVLSPLLDKEQRTNKLKEKLAALEEKRQKIETELTKIKKQSKVLKDRRETIQKRTGKSDQIKNREQAERRLLCQGISSWEDKKQKATTELNRINNKLIEINNIIKGFYNIR